jgi:hypothetical protein
MKIWKTTVKELLQIFKGALTSTVPWLEKAMIEWKGKQAYDDWDNIAEALYNNIVCSSLMGEVMSEYPIAKYGMIYDDYKDLDFIAVQPHGKYSNETLAFICFDSILCPLDKILASILDHQYRVKINVLLDPKETTFYFVSKTKTNEREKRKNITVKL